MSLTIAQINSGVYQALGSPDASLVDPLQIHYAVRNAVMLMTKQMRAGDTNQPLSISSSFLPTASPFEITSQMSGEKSTVAWLERQEGTRWKVVRVVNRAFLENDYDANLPSAAVYSDEQNRTFIAFSTVIPPTSTQNYRVLYDKDPVTVTKATEVLIPDSFAPYVEMLAQNSLIPRVKIQLAERIEDEEQRRIIGLQLEAWDGIIAQNALDMQEWRRLWKSHIHRQRTAQTQDRLPNKRGRFFYGG